MDETFEIFLGRGSNEYTREATRNRINWLCAQARGRVLDVGCSQGLVPWLLGHQGFEVVGVDSDAEALAWAEKKLAEAEPDAREAIQLVQCDFANFNPEERFDTILVGEYLEHLTDEELEIHLAHMGKLLAPGGSIAITVPLGLHPHPDHHQVFLPSNFVRKIGKYFSILEMDVADAYLRCRCVAAQPRRLPDAAELIALSEKGILQLQEKAEKGKRTTVVAELKSCGKKVNDIGCYLTKKQNAVPVNPLTRRLAAWGQAAPFVYDLYLFKKLNEHYAVRPLVPQPREISSAGLFAQADKRVEYLAYHFPDLKGKKCLEIGCGRGETALRLAQKSGCHVTGVDVVTYPEWAERISGQTSLLQIDLTECSPFPNESFDFIFSFTVLEHVHKPLEMLGAMYRLLKPGGYAYLKANLYRGPLASNRYREVFFPWPHLLFDDVIFTRFYKELNGRQGVIPAWINKLTHLHYLEEVRKLGFEVQKCVYDKTPLDEDFYNCFIEKLGRYPREDLELDFIKLKLWKPKLP